MIDREEIPGTAIDVLDVTVNNALINFRRDQLPNPQLLSLWRLAKVVTFELGPMTVFTENADPSSGFTE